MKTTEKILAAIIAAGIIMKLLFLTGRGLALVIGFTGLALLYQFFSFAFFNDIRLRDIFKKQSYSNRSAVRIIGTVVLGFSLSAALMGIFFKFQAYPGAAFLMLDGIICIAICLIAVAIRYSATKANRYGNIISRSVIIGGFTLLLYLTPKVFFFSLIHRDHPAYVQAYKNLNEDPNNKEYQDEFEKQKQLIFGEDK